MFYIPSFKIYGSVAGFYDYGPPGCAIKQNVTQVNAPMSGFRGKGCLSACSTVMARTVRAPKATQTSAKINGII